MSEIDVLRQVEILAGHTEDQLRRLAGLARRRSVRAGENVVTEGETPHELYIIEQGELVVIVEPAADRPASKGTELVTLGRGQVIGEVGLIDRGPRSATVRCTSDRATLLAIDLGQIDRMCEEDPDFGYRLMRNLAADLAFKLRQRNIREKMLW